MGKRESQDSEEGGRYCKVLQDDSEFISTVTHEFGHLFAKLADEYVTNVGETVTLTATVKPDDATDKTITWTTSDASVVTVDNGVVTAKKVGTATITAKTGDKSATCAITVTPTASGGHEGITEEDW